MRSALIEEAGSLFRSKILEKNLYLQTELDEEAPVYLQCDEGKLRQILINLLSKAVKFTSEGGIVLRAWVAKPETGHLTLYVEVEDTGSGIDPDEMDKVFASFEQTRSGKQSHAGTGLGLAISREYVRMMQGEISVTSQPGQGSCFRFFIEACPGESVSTIGEQPKTRITGLKPGQKEFRILVADDKEPNRKLLVKLLSAIGFLVEEASDGQEAVEKFRTWEPHLILMDMVMPVMDGYEAIRLIRSLPGGDHTTIIAVTASVFEEDKQNILNSGADEFIKKPFKEQEILEKIALKLGVDFVTETRQLPVESQHSRITVTSEMVSELPEEIRIRISDAIVNGDIDRIESIIGEISETNPDLSEGLLSLLKSFNFEGSYILFDIQ